MLTGDYITSIIGLPQPSNFVDCATLNAAAFDMAVSLASPSALERYAADGRQLNFVADEEWMDGSWEQGGGLLYIRVS